MYKEIEEIAREKLPATLEYPRIVLLQWGTKRHGPGYYIVSKGRYYGPFVSKSGADAECEALAKALLAEQEAS
jgi:hypothetical protein